MLTVAAVYYAIAAGIPQGRLTDGIGPGGLPKAYAVALAVLSIALIGRALVSRRSTPTTSAPAVKLGRTAAMLAIGAAYAAIAGWVGYVPALAGLILAAIYCQSAARTPIRTALVIAVTGAVVFWVLFVLVLGVPQPQAGVPLW